MNQRQMVGAWGGIALGIWLVFFPYLFGLPLAASLINDVTCGLVLFILSFCILCSKRAGIGWLLLVLGIWLQMAPLVFWAPSALVYVNDTFSGAIALLLSFAISKKEETIKMQMPTGWSFNPSARSHRFLIAMLALICSCFARYMAMFQLGYRDTVWDPFFLDGTKDVISSALSKSFPVSDAGLGALCYTLEFLLAWQGGVNRWKETPWLVFFFAFLIIPVGAVSVLLIILQPLLVGVWCSWCLATALLMLVMIVLAAPELIATLQHLMASRSSKRSAWRLFWQGEKGKPGLFEKESKKGLAAGWTIPPSSLCCFVLGIWIVISPSWFLLCDPLKTMNFIVGPLSIAFSVISCAEVFRPLRYVQIFLGLSLSMFSTVAFFSEGGCAGSLIHLITGLVLCVCCLPRGQVLERYGTVQRYVR